MSSPSSERDPLERLAEEFTNRYRRGEQPSLTEYTQKYPELASQIRELFPGLVVMEEFGSVDDPALGSHPGRPSAGHPFPPRLGEYRILREVGRGGMGVVYEAVQESLGRHVALKVLPFHGWDNPMYRERFRREAQSAAQLHHTNIVPVFGVGEQDGIHYYAMQFIQGQGLNSVLEEVKRLRDREAAPTTAAGGRHATVSLTRGTQTRVVGDLHTTVSLAEGLQTGLFEGHEAATLAAPTASLPGSAEPVTCAETSCIDQPAPQALANHSEAAGDPNATVSLTEGSQTGTTGDPNATVSLTEGSETGLFQGHEAATLAAPTTSLPGSAEPVTCAKMPCADRPSPEVPDNYSGLAQQGQTAYYRSVARIGAQVAEALAYAHTHGIVHRDIKPANLLLDGAGTVWITDFGLAKAEGSEELTHTGDIVGTLRYMAPERFRGVSEPASDIYSLGVTLYEMVTLQPAFAETDRVRLINRVAHEEAPRPRRLDPLIPRDLETVVLKAMAKEPAQRYATAGALAEDLHRFLEDRPIRARRASLREQAWRWCRRNPQLAAVSGLAAFALMVAASLAIGLAIQQSNAARTIRGEQKRTVAALKEMQHLSADLAVDKSLGICEKGDVGPGMLWLAHCLDLATQAEAPDLQQGIRANLGAWREQLHPLRLLLAHEDRIMAVAFSPDGRTLLTASIDGSAQLWEAATGNPLGPPLSHQGNVRAVAFSPDGKNFATAGGTGNGQEGGAWLWDLATERHLLDHPLHHQGEVRAVAFSPDSRTVLTASRDHTAQLWEVATGRPMLKEPLRHNNQIQAVAFSPDGKSILTGSLDLTARLWDVATGHLLRRFEGHVGEIWSVAFSPDGKTVVTGSLDRYARLWDTATGKALPIGPLKQYGPVSIVAFSPSGRIILTAGDGMVRFWDADSGKPVGNPLKHTSGVLAAVFSPDGRMVLTGSMDHHARLWELSLPPSGDVLLDHSQNVSAMAFSPDGQVGISGREDGKAWLWSVATGKLLPSGPLVHEGEVAAVAFSPDSKLVATGSKDTTVRLWQVANGQPIGRPLVHQGEVTSLAFSPDGQTLVSSDTNAIISFWQTSTGKLLAQPLPYQAVVRVLTFSPDGQILLVGSRDGYTRLWQMGANTLVGRPLLTPQGCWSARFSPDSRTCLTGSKDGTVQLWEVSTGKPIGPALQHRKIVTAVAFSPNGRMILTASQDETGRLWQTATGKPIGAPIDFGGSWVLAAAFTPDGRTMLLCDDEMVKKRAVPVVVEGTTERVLHWTQVITGMERDADGAVRALDAPTWHARRQRLQELGGAPAP